MLVKLFMIGKIWQRYILGQFFKVFAFFLLGFYFLYVLIDYSSHVQDFIKGNAVPILDIVKYYLYMFIKRSEVLLPIALLISTIKLLCDLNSHYELAVFQCAGIKIKKLISPILLVGVLCSFANLFLNEYLTPSASNYIDKFEDTHLRHSFRGKRKTRLHVLHLDDYSKLIYQRYDAGKEAFFDVIWLKNADELWRMKYLKADPDNPGGQFIDHLERNADGLLEKTASYSNLLFEDLTWRKDMPRKGFIPVENHSIFHLKSLLNHHAYLGSYKSPEILSQMLYKMTMPLLSLFVIIAIAPFCIRFRRSFLQFFIYGFAIFGFIAFIALIKSSLILGESGTIPPYAAILSPFIALLCIFGYRFAKL